MRKWNIILTVIIIVAAGYAYLPYLLSNFISINYRCIANTILSVSNERRTGWSCLHHAAVSGDAEWVEDLLDNGAEIEARSNQGKTPLYEAAKQGETHIVKLLHKNGADINSVNSRIRFRPVHVAAEYNHLNTLKYIIDQNVDVNIRNYYSQTPLYQASWKPGVDMEVFELLVNSGSDVNVKDYKGFSPLHNTAGKGNYEATRYLITKGANVNIKTNDGQTPLMRAAKNGHYDIVKLLLESDAEIRNEQGRYSAYTLAEKNGYINIMALLEKHGAVDTFQLSELINRGYEYSEKGDYAKSLGVFNQAIELDPESHQAYYYRGRTYESMGKLNLAIKDLRKSLDTEVDDDDSRVSEALHALAYMLTTQRKHSEAIEYYSKLIDMKPDKLVAYRNRAGVYASIGKIEEARKDVRFACENGDHVSCQLYDRLGMNP